jgi:3-hydroxyisobutyrate dehydrogenase-like beta-hydroxyacid dehydrogenase
MFWLGMVTGERALLAASLGLNMGFLLSHMRQHWRRLNWSSTGPRLRHPSRLGEYDVCVMGAGKMGAAFVRRLRSCGVHVIVWNRTFETAAKLAAEPSAGSCLALERPEAACAAVRSGGVVILVLADIAAVSRLLCDDALRAVLAGKVLLNLVSGNPDEGRRVGGLVRDTHLAAFIDGAYSGSPATARAGGGQLFLSSDDGGAAVRALAVQLGILGSVTYSGPIGASRALDYAVVDLYFINYLSWLSNAAMLDAEGVEIGLFAKEAAKRLSQIPAFLLSAGDRMRSRDEESYTANPTATLGTWRSFWASRLPYFAARGLPTPLPELVVKLLDEASGGQEGPHAHKDVTRLQEVLRFPSGPRKL